MIESSNTRLANADGQPPIPTGKQLPIRPTVC